MSFIRSSKTVIPIEAITTTAGTALTGNIDTMGFDALLLNVFMGTQSATTKPTALKLSESDDTVVTNFADISGFVGGTDFTIPQCYTSTTSGQWCAKFNVDCRARKRYIKVSLTTGTVSYAAAIGLLTHGEKAPVLAADAGAAVIVEA